jgi:hypothetical protein
LQSSWIASRYSCWFNVKTDVFPEPIKTAAAVTGLFYNLNVQLQFRAGKKILKQQGFGGAVRRKKPWLFCRRFSLADRLKKTAPALYFPITYFALGARG